MIDRQVVLRIPARINIAVRRVGVLHVVLRQSSTNGLLDDLDSVIIVVDRFGDPIAAISHWHELRGSKGAIEIIVGGVCNGHRRCFGRAGSSSCSKTRPPSAGHLTRFAIAVAADKPLRSDLCRRDGRTAVLVVCSLGQLGRGIGDLDGSTLAVIARGDGIGDIGARAVRHSQISDRIESEG
ncbi:hypothetical protein D9M72_329310 [compost metagenome]